MRKIFFLAAVCVLFCACYGTKTDPVVLLVGDIKVTKSQFEEDFKRSPYGGEDTPQNRAKFLESYALRLMILKEAQREGLDRDPKFLKDVEFFWQQALVKLMMEKKSRAAAAGTRVGEDDIIRYYNAHAKQCCPGKTLQEARPYIASLFMSEQKKKILEGWLEYMKSKASIKANKALLGLK